MSNLRKQAFYNNLRGFMRADRADYMRKVAQSDTATVPALNRKTPFFSTAEVEAVKPAPPPPAPKRDLPTMEEIKAALDRRKQQIDPNNQDPAALGKDLFKHLYRQAADFIHGAKEPKPEIKLQEQHIPNYQRPGFKPLLNKKSSYNALCKRAASPADIPPELLQQVQQPMPGPSPEELAAMQQGAPGPEGDPSQAQAPAQPQSEKLNIQAIGPDAIDAIKGMMGNQVAEVAAANPEGIKMASLNKKAAFRSKLAGFMRYDRGNALRKQAAYSNVKKMIKDATK